MQFTYDHDLHVHSCRSTCSKDAGQTTEFLLQYALENRLSTICLTNHFWDEKLPCSDDWYRVQNLKHVTQDLPLPQAEGVRFLFGCETELDFRGTLGITRENFDRFDFIAIPLTHFNKVGFVLTEEQASSAQNKARTWLERLSRVLSMDLPFAKTGLAHLACPLISRYDREEYLAVLDLLPQRDLDDLFSEVARLGIGVEINTRDFFFSEEETECVMRMFYTARECGCKFYLASDAHERDYFEKAKRSFARAIALLDLQETDKFLLP
ncbi:MAG: hypothetical protein IKT43_01955 [Clostridia bacterium]|nr:hypothetical protein [Clostridia bacterium]